MVSGNSNQNKQITNKAEYEPHIQWCVGFKSFCALDKKKIDDWLKKAVSISHSMVSRFQNCYMVDR